MRTTLAVLALTFTLTTSATAATVAGVQLADKVEQSGQTLVLNGAGVRTKVVFKVYVAGLYLANRNGDAAAILRDGGPRRVQMVMLRDLSRDQIVDAVVEGFRKNAGAKMPTLQARLDRLVSVVPELKEGQSLTISWDPARGTTLDTSTGRSVTVEGRDFADALFAVWLGQHPVDAKLKQAMLGRGV